MFVDMFCDFYSINDGSFKYDFLKSWIGLWVCFYAVGV